MQQSTDTLERPKSATPLQKWPRRHWPEALSATIALAFATIFIDIIPGPDVAWQLWIAHQLRMGARLYVDIIEINPPLWFWEAMPLDWAGNLIHVPSHVLLVLATSMTAALSVLGTGRLLGHIPTGWRAPLLAYAVLTLLLMPLIDTGQREQFLLIAILPYATLAAMRREGRDVSRTSAVLIAVGAALGLALKHYYALAPTLIELWLLASMRRQYRPLRPETITLAVMAVVYGTAILILTPDYLSHMVPIGKLAYMALNTTKIDDMFRPIQWYWLLALVPLALELKAVRHSALTSAMAVATLGLGLAWLIQFRGFPYHSIAVSGCLMMTLAYFALEHRHKIKPVTVTVVAMIMLLPLGFTAWYGPNQNPFGPYSRRMIQGVGPHDSVAFVNYEAVFSWPLSLYRDAPYPTRQYGWWILSAVARDHGHTPQLATLGQQTVAESVQDFRCDQPTRIIFSRSLEQGRTVRSWFDPNPDFNELMKHYKLIDKYLIFDIYQKKDPYPKPPATACRRSY